MRPVTRRGFVQAHADAVLLEDAIDAQLMDTSGIRATRGASIKAARCGRIDAHREAQIVREG